MIADDFVNIRKALDEIKKEETEAEKRDRLAEELAEKRDSSLVKPVNTVYGIWVKSPTVFPQPDTPPPPPVTT